MNRSARRRELLTAFCREEQIDFSHLEKLFPNDAAEWELLVRHILAHGIQGPTWEFFRRPGLDSSLPEKELNRLHESVWAASVKNLYHKRALCRVLDALGPEVPVLLHKGIALAQYSYQRPSMRPMVDIDLFIRLRDVEFFENTLDDLGFIPEDRRKRSRQWWIDNFQHLEPLFSPDGVCLEAHLRLAGNEMPFQLDVDGLWERSTEVAYEGRPVRLMTPDDELAALILHLYVHQIHLVKLLGLVDLDRTIRKSSNLDWDRFLQLARKQGYLHLLYLPLRLCRELLKTPVSEQVLNACRPENWAEVDIAFMLDYIFRDDLDRERMPFGAVNVLDSNEGDKLTRLLRRFFYPTTETITTRFNLPDNSKLIWLYRLLYPLAQIRRWYGFLIGFLFGSKQRRLLALSRRVKAWSPAGKS